MELRIVLVTGLVALASAAFADAGSTAPAWKVQGWIEGAYGSSSASTTNLPVGFQYQPDKLQLDQAWLRLDRPSVNEPGRTLVGYHLDLLVGADYNFTRARGLLSSQTGEIGFDPIQFYVEIPVRGLSRRTSVKVGRFYSPYGVEANDGPSNQLTSHAYTFIYNPFTHTGVLATTRLSDRWSATYGLVLGCDVFLDAADRATFVGNVRWASSDQKTSAQLATIQGPGRFDAVRTFNHPRMFDLVLTRQLSKLWAYSLEGLVGWQDGVPDLGDTHWQGLIHYLTCTFDDRLSGTTRLELFSDDQGQRTGFAGDTLATTVGLNWKAKKWLIVRPELRYDHNNTSAPFEGRNHLWVATLDLMMKW